MCEVKHVGLFCIYLILAGPLFWTLTLDIQGFAFGELHKELPLQTLVDGKKRVAQSVYTLSWHTVVGRDHTY